MLKATAGTVLPTTVTGSLPRPSWYTENLGTRSFLDAMVDIGFRDQYLDALTVYLRDQTLAGLTNHAATTAARVVNRLGASTATLTINSPASASWNYAGGIGSAAKVCFAEREKKRSRTLGTLGSSHASRHRSLFLLRLDALALPGVDTVVLSPQLQS